MENICLTSQPKETGHICAWDVTGWRVIRAPNGRRGPDGLMSLSCLTPDFVALNSISEQQETVRHSHQTRLLCTQTQRHRIPRPSLLACSPSVTILTLWLFRAMLPADGQCHCQTTAEPTVSTSATGNVAMLPPRSHTRTCEQRLALAIVFCYSTYILCNSTCH